MKKSVVYILPILVGASSYTVQAQTAQAQTTQAPAKKVGAPAAKPAEKIDLVKAQKMADRILKETAVLRELPVKHGVKTKVMTSKQVEKMLEGDAVSELTNNQLLASEIFVRQLGLGPADFQLKATYIKMMGEQIGGFYKAKSNTFTTTDRTDPMQLETVMAHELTHALQDQHFDLSRLENWPDHDGDARIAMSALAEGDATFVMMKYMQRNPLRSLGMMMSSLKSAGKSPSFDSAPKILRESVVFPYIGGMQFVTRLHTDGGWKGISQAYTDLPKSTEQIIHYEKYLAGEAPVKVAIRDLTPQLGAGWKLLDHDVNGELGLQLVVGEHLGDEAAAKKAAEGWGGDRYSVYRSAKGGALIVQDIRWDSLNDANEWRSAYAKSATNRMGARKRQTGGLAVWTSGNNGIWMEQRGSRVLILEGTLGSFNRATLLTTLWRP